MLGPLPVLLRTQAATHTHTQWFQELSLQSEPRVQSSAGPEEEPLAVGNDISVVTRLVRENKDGRTKGTSRYHAAQIKTSQSEGASKPRRRRSSLFKYSVTTTK